MAEEYDPAVSGPWSDVDERPLVREPISEPSGAELAGIQRYWAESNQRMMESALDEWDRDNPLGERDGAYLLARKLRESQPHWAGHEECAVDPDMVRDALDALKLKLVPQ